MVCILHISQEFYKCGWDNDCRCMDKALPVCLDTMCMARNVYTCMTVISNESCGYYIYACCTIYNAMI